MSKIAQVIKLNSEFRSICQCMNQQTSATMKVHQEISVYERQPNN